MIIGQDDIERGTYVAMLESVVKKDHFRTFSFGQGQQVGDSPTPVAIYRHGYFREFAFDLVRLISDLARATLCGG